MSKQTQPKLLCQFVEVGLSLTAVIDDVILSLKLIAPSTKYHFRMKKENGIFPNQIKILMCCCRVAYFHAT
jgi:hypothetical protein